VLSPRFEHSLRQLAEHVATCRDTSRGTRDKDQVLISFAAARCAGARPEGTRHTGNSEVIQYE
jgi:hypothetical protein